MVQEQFNLKKATELMTSTGMVHQKCVVVRQESYTKQVNSILRKYFKMTNAKVSA